MMLGDRMDTDVVGGFEAVLDTILVLTGWTGVLRSIAEAIHLI